MPTNAGYCPAWSWEIHYTFPAFALCMSIQRAKAWKVGWLALSTRRLNLIYKAFLDLLPSYQQMDVLQKRYCLCFQELVQLTVPKHVAPSAWSQLQNDLNLVSLDSFTVIPKDIWLQMFCMLMMFFLNILSFFDLFILNIYVCFITAAIKLFCFLFRPRLLKKWFF